MNFPGLLKIRVIKCIQIWNEVQQRKLKKLFLVLQEMCIQEYFETSLQMALNMLQIVAMIDFCVSTCQDSKIIRLISFTTHSFCLPFWILFGSSIHFFQSRPLPLDINAVVWQFGGYCSAKTLTKLLRNVF